MKLRQLAAQALLDCSDNPNLTIKQSAEYIITQYHIDTYELIEFWFNIDELLIDQFINTRQEN